jgi:electron transfer flavoprotein beta subunit
MAVTVGKVAVCVKYVPEGRIWIDPGSRRLDRTGPGGLNGVDLHAVEEALRVKDQTGAEVVAVSMGPHKAVEALRGVLALGADRALLISDENAAGSDLIATSKVLAFALEREAPDLVLFGQQASDGGGALLWAAVAELLQRPLISQAAELTLDAMVLRATRQTEAGDEVIEASLPAVVAVSDAINEPRSASLREIMAAKKKPLDVMTISELGIDLGQAGESGSKTVVQTISKPPARVSHSKVVDEAEGPEAIIEFLLERQLI